MTKNLNQICSKLKYKHLTVMLSTLIPDGTINKVTCHAVWTPALSLGVFITREISENILSFPVRHSLTEFIIAMHIYFFVMGHRLDGANVKMDK